MKIVPGGLMRKINFLEETQNKHKRPILTKRQANYASWSSAFFNINITQEQHTMNLLDLLDVDLYNENLKMFNQAWEETLSAPCLWFGWTCSQKTCTRGIGENSLHSWRMLWPVYQSGHCSEKGADRCYHKIKDYAESHSRAPTSEHVDFSKGALRRPSRSSVLIFWEEKGEDCRSWTSKCSCLKGGNMFFLTMTRQQKGKGKKHSTKNTRLNRDNSAEKTKQARKTGKSPSGKEDRSSMFHLQKRKVVVMIKSVVIGILRIANTSRKTNVRWERTVHSFTHKRRIVLPVLNKKNKEKQVSEKGEVTVANVNIANHRPRYTSWKVLQFETSRNTLSRAKGHLKPEARSKMPMKGILALRRTLPSEKISMRLLHQSLERAKIRDTIPSLNGTQTGGKNEWPPNAPPYDQRSKELNEEQEEVARQ